MRDIKDVTAIYQNHQKAIVQANALNKESVFDALGRAGIGLVLVDFDGESDEGQVENLQAYMDDKPVPLPTETIPFNIVSWNAHKLDASTMPIAEAIETLCYDYLEQEHGGWENNDGAYGDFTFDVAGRSIELNFNARFSDSTLFSHSF